MFRHFSLIIFTSVVVVVIVVLGAPSEKSDNKKIPSLISQKPFIDERERNFSVSSWIVGNLLTALADAIAILVIFIKLAVAFSFVIYERLNGYSYTDPDKSVQSIGRSLQDTYKEAGSNSSTWSWSRVLYLISMAQDYYENFDFHSFECQKKDLCELSQRFIGEETYSERKMSRKFSNISQRIMDVGKGLPMPTIIMKYLNEYKEAMNHGTNSSIKCSIVYPKCIDIPQDILLT